MKRIVLLLPAVLFISALQAQHHDEDLRPFGKYLVEVCTLSNVPGPGLNCLLPPDWPAPPSAAQLPQAISIKQAGCAQKSSGSCDPVYPLPVYKSGVRFFVNATADSGLPVVQSVVSGNAAPQFDHPPYDPGTQEYSYTGPGPVVIRATQAGSAQYGPAAPVELTLAVSLTEPTDSDKSDATCSGLLAAPSATQIQPLLDPPSIINLMGTPTPFTLVAQGKNTILIYASRFPDKEEQKILDHLVARMQKLVEWRSDVLGISAPAKPFSVELRIPHAAALGDLATRIGALNYSQFTVQDIGSSAVRINSTSTPDCKVWTAFLKSIRNLAWQITPEPFSLKLYYLSSTDAATAFTALAPAAPAPAAATPAPSGGTPAASNSASGAPTVSLNQPPGSRIEVKSDTTPCVVAGLILTNSSACAPAASGSSTTAASTPPANTPAAPKPIGMAPMAVAQGTVEQIPSDLLVFSDANSGDDEQIVERKRILAQLDLPRPEMMINAWVMQNSTANPQAMGKFSSVVRDLVGEYNGALEQVVVRGWGSVRGQTQAADFFNRPFYHYIADRYIAESYTAPTSKTTNQDAAQNLLENGSATMVDPESRTNNFGICKANRYCLGYDLLFQPLKPRLTDLLLTLIAADNPLAAAKKAIKDVEIFDRAPPLSEAFCEGFVSMRELRDRCRAIWFNMGLDRITDPPSCASRDLKDTLYSIFEGAGGRPPSIYLECFYDAADTFLRDPGLLRSAIADFLYQYKLSQQYPHEFGPYELSQSADSLNSALALLIDAFNRDIAAFQTFMRADVQYQVDRLNNDTDQRCCAKRLFGLDKPSFFNDGLVTVRTISGQPTSVTTTSQSVLDSSSAPTISNLLNSIGTGGAPGASPLSGALGAASQPGVALLAGVLNAYQTTRVQIGRQLSLQVTPRSLSTASSAELSVTLSADEVSGGPVFTGGPASGAAPDLSRVANHDVTSRIRVESVKLFELSSFSAILQRSRSRFPLLPPFVEIPYIGTVLGIPIPGAKEYHSSTAIISAMVVPTAADIAYGLRFAFDQVVDSAEGGASTCSFITGSAGTGSVSPCKFRRAVSMGDLKQPVRNFHKSLLNCFASNMSSPYTSYGTLSGVSDGACKNLSFDRVPH